MWSLSAAFEVCHAFSIQRNCPYVQYGFLRKTLFCATISIVFVQVKSIYISFDCHFDQAMLFCSIPALANSAPLIFFALLDFLFFFYYFSFRITKKNYIVLRVVMIKWYQLAGEKTQTSSNNKASIYTRRIDATCTLHTQSHRKYFFCTFGHG